MKTLALLISLMALSIQIVQADEFFCQSGDVTCLISAIDKANYKGGEHTITLDPGTYTLQSINNSSPNDFANGLPIITSSIYIQASTDDYPTIIERDPNAPAFRIFHVSVGDLSLTGLTVDGGQEFGHPRPVSGEAILNEQGKVSLYDSVIRNTLTFGEGAINNGGTLNLFRTIVFNNAAAIEVGGILNRGTAFIEFSTISNNVSQLAGGILNSGTMVVRNSSIISNSGHRAGGISNEPRPFFSLSSPSLEIINSTIANNEQGTIGGGGGGIFNQGGQIFITNSTIRENASLELFSQGSGGIVNRSGTVKIQNTVVAENTRRIINENTVSECVGTITSLGNNLIGDPSGCDINLQSTDLTGDQGLGGLVDEEEAGRTFFPVLAGSVLINNGNNNACPATDQLGLPRGGPCDIGAIEFQEIHVFSDIRPRKDANRVNPNSTKNINVVIFSSSDIGFDATTVDPNTIRFGATGTEAAPINVNPKDTDGDGFRDLVVRFKIQDTGIKCGDTSAFLTGIAGGVPIISSSPLKTVQCK